jgi:hypothetical protein
MSIYLDTLSLSQRLGRVVLPARAAADFDSVGRNSCSVREIVIGYGR